MNTKRLRWLSGILTAAMLLTMLPALSMRVSAAETDNRIEGTNITAIYDSATDTLTLSGTGSMPYDYSWERFYRNVKHVVVEDGVEDFGKFYDCHWLESISIPASVTSLQWGVFHDCWYLQEVVIPGDVREIPDSAFFGCDKLKRVVLPANVQKIANSAFSGCIALESVNIPDTVQEMGRRAFYKCNALTAVDIPEGVSKIEMEAFCGCEALKSVVIPSTIKEIEMNAFMDCKALETVQINAPLTEIPEACFSSCTSLKSINIPSTVTDIGAFAFAYCRALENVTIPSGVTEIKRGTFLYCESLTFAVIPTGVHTIDKEVFQGCIALQNITIAQSVTEIGDYAFAQCTSLANLGDMSHVEHFGARPFEDTAFAADLSNWDGDGLYVNNWLVQGRDGVSGTFTIRPGTKGISGIIFKTASNAGSAEVTEVVIPDGVTDIGGGAFSNSPKLAAVNVPDSVRHIGTGAFLATALYKDSANWTDDLLYVGHWLVAADKYYSGSCDVKNGTIGIADEAFSRYNGHAYDASWRLTSINIPSSVKYIGEHAFTDCYNGENSGLRTVGGASGVVSIGEGAFSGCENLRSFPTPAGLKELPDELFMNCTLLSDFELPAGTTKIGDSALYYTSTALSNGIPNTVTEIGQNAFSGCPITQLSIPASITRISDGAFKGCKELTNISIPDTVTYIGKSAFDSSGLTAIRIPDGVTRIEDSAFEECRSLTRVDNLSGITEIGAEAFLYCTALKIFTVPEGVTALEEGVFAYSGLEHIQLPASLRSIGTSAFSGVHGLTEIDIPDGVETIDTYALSSTDLTDITLPSNLKTIGYMAFATCDGLTQITIPASVTQIYSRAFYNANNLITMSILNPDVWIGGTMFARSSFMGDYGFQICGYAGSTAEKNANANLITFVPICTGEHQWGEWVDISTTSIPCKENGLQCRTCTVCGTKQTEIIPPKAHHYELRTTDATCMWPGECYYYCLTCGDISERTEIPALNHDYSYAVTVSPTVSEEGTLTGTCSRCEETAEVTLPNLNMIDYTYEEIPSGTEQIGRYTWNVTDYGAFSFDTALGHVHSYTAQVTPPTCTAQGYTTHTCSACGDILVDTYTDALGHTWGDWTVTTPATATEDGVETRICSRCGETETRAIPTTGVTVNFNDVDSGAYYAAPVSWAVSLGVTKGTSDTTFSPDATCTRGQVVTFLWRAKGEPEPKSSRNPFTDVNASQYYYKAVLWAVEQGITSGTSATTFLPDDGCTRGQVATFLWRAEEKPDPAAGGNPFGDVGSGEYYYNAVLWAVGNGITNGTSASSFSPGATCTRGQIVTFLWRDLK